MSFHLILLVKLAIWVQKCEEIDKNNQKSHFFQIFAHFSPFGQFNNPHTTLNGQKILTVFQITWKTVFQFNIFHKIGKTGLIKELFEVVFNNFCTFLRPVLLILLIISNEKTLFPCNLRH